MMITEELLRRFHEGLCTHEEEEAVKRWLREDEDLPSEIDIIDVKEFRDSTDSILNKVKLLGANLSESEGDSVVPLDQDKNGKHRFKYWVAAAAIIIATFGFSFYYLSDSFGLVNNQTVADSYKVINTKRAEKRTVILSDGSTVRMNYETEIRVPEQFEKDERIVYLKGQAYFDVSRDTERPFIIYTEDSKTQVLGTSFDINTKEHGQTKIIVTSGKVAFSERNQPDNLVTLTLNDRAILSADKSIATDEVNAKRLTGWTENRLAFYNQTFEEIIEVIEPWYNVEVTVNNPEVLSMQYTFIYDNPSLSLLMERMSVVAGFEYRIEGQSVIVE